MIIRYNNSKEEIKFSTLKICVDTKWGTPKTYYKNYYLNSGATDTFSIKYYLEYNSTEVEDEVEVYGLTIDNKSADMRIPIEFK